MVKVGKNIKPKIKIDANKTQSELGSEIKDSYLNIMRKVSEDPFFCFVGDIFVIEQIVLETIEEKNIKVY